MDTAALETLQERLTTLEQEMTQVKERLEVKDVQKTNPWLDYVYGAFKDDPLFEEAIKHGREWRASQNEDEGEGHDVSAGHR